jgi:hypothetical protein
MARVPDASRHSRFTDPGDFADVLAAVSPDPAALSAVARNLIVHYRASGEELPEATRGDVNLCWLDAILATDQRRHGEAPLTDAREPAQRVQGCCRDHSLFGVSVLRQHGHAARSRVGFAGYFTAGHHHDHVIVERWDSSSDDIGRWVCFDPELAGRTDPDAEDIRGALPDSLDIEVALGAPFETAAQVWRGYRAGELEPSTYAIEPGSDIGGPWFIHNYVLLEAAHRFGDEVLLWDSWGAMVGDQDPLDDPGAVALVDEIAALLVAADDGDTAAEAALYERYVADARLHPGTSVLRYAPLGETAPVEVDLTRGR